MGVVVSLGLLGIGLWGWTTAVDATAGRLFLCITVLTGLITLAGAGPPFLPHAYLFGSPALVFLAAVILHFHLLFPREVDERWRHPLVVISYTLAGVLATAWALRPDLPYLRVLSRAGFLLALLASWARLVIVGHRWGTGLEEKWAARWLAIVLLVGGILPSTGVLVAEMAVGRRVMPLAVAYLLAWAVPLGYGVVLRRHGLWTGSEPVSHRGVATVAGTLVGGYWPSWPRWA